MLMLGILVFMLFEAPREEREINSFIFILFLECLRKRRT